MSEFYVAKFEIINIKDLWAGILFPFAFFPFLFPSSVIPVFTAAFPNVFKFSLLCPLKNSWSCLLLPVPPALLFGVFLFGCPHWLPGWAIPPSCEFSHWCDACNLKSIQMMMLIAKYICRYESLSCWTGCCVKVLIEAIVVVMLNVLFVHWFLKLLCKASKASYVLRI